MKRRNNGEEPAANGRGDAWATGWADAWEDSEQERVARWLTAKGRVAVRARAAPVDGRAVRRVDPWEASDLLDLREMTAAPRADRRSAHEAEADGPGPVRPDPEAPAPVEPDAATTEQLHARSALEAELVYLEDERRRQAARLEDERSEAERVRRDLSTAAAMLHDHIAGLEQERRRVLEGVEASVAAAERARADEQAARAALEAARDEARAVEAKHFEVWVALEEEVSALVARRRRLRALRRRRPVPRAAAAS